MSRIIDLHEYKLESLSRFNHSPALPIMKLLQSLLVAAAVAVCTLSLPSSNLAGVELESASKRAEVPEIDRPCILGSGSLWYCSWADDPSSANITFSRATSTMQMFWKGNGEIVGGAGWNPGSSGR